MSDTNPYAAPESDLEVPIDATNDALKPPRSVAAGHGWSWIEESWRLFRSSVGVWIGVTIVYFLVMILMSLIPVLGNVLPTLLGPAFMAGFVWAARSADCGEAVSVGLLFDGFNKRGGALIGVGALSLLFGVVLVVLGGGLFLWFSGADLNDLDGLMANPRMMSTFVMVLLLAMALYIPFVMALWFAPALLVLHEELSIFQAMGLSFKGCVKNMLPFLVWGIAALVLTILAMLPLGLGFLVLLPMMMMAPYVSYKDIFLHRD